MGSYIDGLVEDCSIAIANAPELLQSCTKPSKCSTYPTEEVGYDHQSKFLGQVVLVGVAGWFVSHLLHGGFHRQENGHVAATVVGGIT